MPDEMPSTTSTPLQTGADGNATDAAADADAAAATTEDEDDGGDQDEDDADASTVADSKNLGIVIGSVVAALLVVILAAILVIRIQRNGDDKQLPASGGGGGGGDNVVVNHAYDHAYGDRTLSVSDYQVPNIPRMGGKGVGGSTRSAIDRPGYDSAFGGDDANYDVPAEVDTGNGNGDGNAYSDAGLTPEQSVVQSLAADVPKTVAYTWEPGQAAAAHGASNGEGQFDFTRRGTYLEPGQHVSGSGDGQFDFTRRGTYLEPGQHVAGSGDGQFDFTRRGTYLEPGQHVSGTSMPGVDDEEDGPSYATPMADDGPGSAVSFDPLYADAPTNLQTVSGSGGGGEVAEYAYQGLGELGGTDGSTASEPRYVEPMSGVYVTPASKDGAGSLYAEAEEFFGEASTDTDAGGGAASRKSSLSGIEHTSRPLARKASTYAGFGGADADDQPQPSADALARKASTYAGFSGAGNDSTVVADMGDGTVWEGDESEEDEEA